MCHVADDVGFVESRHEESKFDLSHLTSLKSSLLSLSIWHCCGENRFVDRLTSLELVAFNALQLDQNVGRSIFFTVSQNYFN